MTPLPSSATTRSRVSRAGGDLVSPAPPPSPSMSAREDLPREVSPGTNPNHNHDLSPMRGHSIHLRAVSQSTARSGQPITALSVRSKDKEETQLRGRSVHCTQSFRPLRGHSVRCLLHRDRVRHVDWASVYPLSGYVGHKEERRLPAGDPTYRNAWHVSVTRVS